MEFSDFFTKAVDKKPYEYQCLLAEGDWPEVLIAPTGLGKTAAVVLGWLWRRCRAPKVTPRRLVYCLPMRTLVEQTANKARDWLGKLADPNLEAILPSCDDVHVLMGGIEAGRKQLHWYETPERSAILIGTQDMLISRGLMRGYASGRARWPLEFALLHNDAQWVFDEVQLMGAGLPTSVQLHAFRDHWRVKSTPLSNSLWVSATLDPHWLRTVDFNGPRKVLRVPDDAPNDVSSLDVRRLIDASKPLARSSVAPQGTTKADIEAYIDGLAGLVRDVRLPGRLTLVIVNTVERAQMLHEAVRKTGIVPAGLVHSRFRPSERREQMNRLLTAKEGVVIATQAVEAGVDFTSGVLVTELAPWSSLVQRFGRVNRYGEWTEKEGGSPVYWVDLVGDRGEDDKEAQTLARPYAVEELREARERLLAFSDAAPVNLRDPGKLAPPRRVIRRKDLIDLFDTDPDLTGFDVDISPYVRDAADTDVHVFWRDIEALPKEADSRPLRPASEELCAVSIWRVNRWITALRKRKQPVYVSDPLWRVSASGRTGIPPGWQTLQEAPWPGLTILVDCDAGGYDSTLGFLGEASSAPVKPADQTPADPTDADQEDGDETSGGFPQLVTLRDHTDHVVTEAKKLCAALDVNATEKDAVMRAARWHDIGKAHRVFQETMRRAMQESKRYLYNDVLLAKSEHPHLKYGRPYFRHELASALAFLAHENWKREADLIAYLIAAHHGKVRMSLRARPKEREPVDRRFARGIWEGDELPSVDLGEGEAWQGGRLTLSIMEFGEDPISGASWTERTRELLDCLGPFQLAWLEALITIADWRASASERRGNDD